MATENLNLSLEYDPDFPTYVAFLQLDELNDLIESVEFRIEMNRQAMRSMTDVDEADVLQETLATNERLTSLKNELENVRDVIGPLGAPNNRATEH